MILPATRLQTVEEYYFSRKLREVRELIALGRPVINMGIGSPDLSPSEEVLRAMKDSLNEAGAHQYQSYQGLDELRLAMAGFYREQFGLQMDPATEILPLMGSKEGIMHISMAFLNPGDEVLIPDPGYPTYTSVTRLVGGIPQYYSLRREEGWLPDLKALKSRDLSKVKLMWINYPHMPTGARASLEQLEEIVAFAREAGLLLVNDNPYSFVLNDNPVSLMKVENATDTAMELNSLSKTFNMAGWRVGMLLGSKDHIQAVLKVKSNMDSGMFYGIQKGAVAALKSSPGWYDSLNAVYSKRRLLVFALAERLQCRYEPHTAGMFVWAALPARISSSEAFVEELLQERNLFVAPGTIFGKGGEGYIRFSLCVKQEKIQEALGRF